MAAGTSSVMQRLVTRVEAELTTEEVELAMFLLTDTASGATTFWDALRNTCGRDSSMFNLLAELLFCVQRLDVSKRLMGLSRDFSVALANSGVVPQMRKALLKAHDGLGSEDVFSVWFLCRDLLGTKRCDGSFIHLVQDLEAVGAVSLTNMCVIHRCLLTIGRKDLAQPVRNLCRNRPRLGRFPVTTAAGCDP
uniref:MC159L n=1 Tax=Rousettus bat poxvirus TaxID=3141933 RepID=A0AAU7E2J2_9POXV